MKRKSIWKWIGGVALMLTVAGTQSLWSWQETQTSQEPTTKEPTTKKKAKKKTKSEAENATSAERAQQPPESTGSRTAKPSREQE